MKFKAGDKVTVVPFGKTPFEATVNEIDEGFIYCAPSHRGEIATRHNRVLPADAPTSEIIKLLRGDIEQIEEIICYI